MSKKSRRPRPPRGHQVPADYRLAGVEPVSAEMVAAAEAHRKTRAALKTITKYGYADMIEMHDGGHLIGISITVHADCIEHLSSHLAELAERVHKYEGDGVPVDLIALRVKGEVLSFDDED